MSRTTTAVTESLKSLKQRYQWIFNNDKKILEALKKREQKDNKRAAGMGLKQYTLKRVGIATSGLFSGWVYLVLDVGEGKERLHIETSLNDAIMSGKLTGISSIRKDYIPAGDYKESDIDFIEGGATTDLQSLVA